MLLFTRDNSIEVVLFDKCASEAAAAYQGIQDTIIVAVLNLCRVSSIQSSTKTFYIFQNKNFSVLTINYSEINITNSFCQTRRRQAAYLIFPRNQGDPKWRHWWSQKSHCYVRHFLAISSNHLLCTLIAVSIKYLTLM